jgi:hypothetical protein
MVEIDGNCKSRGCLFVFANQMQHPTPDLGPLLCVDPSDYRHFLCGNYIKLCIYFVLVDLDAVLYCSCVACIFVKHSHVLHFICAPLYDLSPSTRVTWAIRRAQARTHRMGCLGHLDVSQHSRVGRPSLATGSIQVRRWEPTCLN